MTLEQNYPNPFNGQTIIRYSVASAGRVTLTLFDLLGRVVQTLVDGEQTQGAYEVSVSTNSLASGIYIYYAWDDEGHEKTGKRAIIK